MGYADSSNLYAFAGGDPVNRRDPTGNCVNPFNPQCRADIVSAIETGKTYAMELTRAASDTYVKVQSGAIEGVINLATAGQYNGVKQAYQQGKIRIPGSLGEAEEIAQSINDARVHGTADFLTGGTLDRSMDHLEHGGSSWTQPLVALDARIGYSEMDDGFARLLQGDLIGAAEFSGGFAKLTGNAAVGLSMVQAAAPQSVLNRNTSAILDDVGVTTPPSRWARGESIVRRTASGNPPAWGTVRSRYWKNEGLSRPPTRTNQVTGTVESMELNHRFIPQRWNWVPNAIRNAPWNLEAVWPAEHAAVDWYRWQTLDPRLKPTVPEPPKPWF